MFRLSLQDVRLNTLFVLLFLLAFLTACQTQGTSDTRADEAALKKLDDEWSKTTGSRNVEKMLSYYSDDAVVMMPNIPALTGKESIRAFWNSMLDSPSFSGGWSATKIEVARSADLAYITGNYEFKENDGGDRSMMDKGKYFSAWKKQSDGSWKCVADVFSSDLPVPVPAR